MSLSVPDFSSIHLLVAGDAMLDEYWFGDTARISPEAPVPVVQAMSREQRAGGAANVAVNLAALGARANFIGVVGDDAAGAALGDLLSAEHVEHTLLRGASVPTIHKLRVLARNQQLIRLDAERDLTEAGGEVTRAVADAAGQGQFVVLSDYGKGTLADVEELITRLADKGCRVLVDPKGLDFGRYRHCFCLTPNQSEFAAVVGRWDSEAE
ncbi:MAG: PfkB family carbohydrate kinase, partial [Gammaproteobacteria bacterium]